MALKKRNKVSAEFAMSSLTDIIFLLLIFFMLTSTLIKIQRFDLPESNAKTIAPTNVAVEIRRDGSLFVNRSAVPAAGLHREIADQLGDLVNNRNTTITIVAETGVEFDKVATVMGIAQQLNVRAILATQPIKK